MTNKGPSLPISIPKILASLALGIAVAILFLWILLASTRDDEVSETEDVLTEVVLSSLPEIRERWEQGDREGAFTKDRWACEDLPFSPNVAPAFLRCQPRYLECWARGKAGASESLSVKLGQKTYKVRLAPAFPEQSWLGSGKRHGHWITFSDTGLTTGLLVDIVVEGVGHWPVLLEDTCRDSYLPERVYSYGARPERGTRPTEMLWDNVGRRIFVDKFLVSRADVGLWKKEKVALTELALPALDLTSEQQEAYCAWRGARRLEAHLWDAATMTPPDPNRPFPEFIVKPWLPWTRDRRGTFFEEALKNTEWKPTRLDCARAFVKECEGVADYMPHHADNVSWMGVYHVLGGEAERFRNPVEPKLVARASNRRRSARSEKHQLGVREKTSERLGFRCYREVFP